MSEQDGTPEEHRDPHAMVGAYVTDALDADERAAYEQHLAGCASCRREVAEFGETLGELSWLPETAPPASLRASVLAEIATVRPLPPPEPAAAPVDELAARRQRRIRRILTGLVAAALIGVVALGGWVAVLVSEQRSQQVAAEQVSQLLTAPDATVYATTLHGAHVSYVVSKQRNQAMFVSEDVPSPGPDKTFQLWTMHGSDATSQGLLAGGSGAQWFTGSLEQADTLAVSVEPAGGSPTPTTDPLALVKLS